MLLMPTIAADFLQVPDAAYSLDLPGSERGGDENRLDDELLAQSDEKSEIVTLVWEKIEFNFTTGGTGEEDPNALFFAYTELMEGDWSGLEFSWAGYEREKLEGLTCH